MDPLLQLAFALHSSKGVYALLLGSGLSRSAEIPTGWEIVLDLVRRIASLEREACEPDPASWYAGKFGRAPEYSRVLDEVARLPAERNLLLRQYFEPNAEERERGAKVPTQAHRAIARLVAGGYIRLIVTTNFDALTERALDDIGISFTVISTPDQLLGALPIVHAGPTIVKVHGDYRDVRVRNTPAELEMYDDATNHLLDRIFDEFGLVVCGWSAEWDLALRAAIERCPSRRFTTFWASRGAPSGAAMRLIEQRAAQPISIRDADSFFDDLAEGVAALGRVESRHPLSAKLAVERLKKYLHEPSRRIDVRDLVMTEVDSLWQRMTSAMFDLNRQCDDVELRARVERYESLTEVLRLLVVEGCYWDDGTHRQVWIEVLERLGTPVRGGGVVAWIHLHAYPALQLLYAGGMAALAGNQIETFAALLTKPTIVSDRARPLLLKLYPQKVLERDLAQHLPGLEGRFTPLSDRLFVVLRESLRPYLPDDLRYERTFDRFEYLLAIVFADLNQKVAGREWWFPAGRFSWKQREELTQLMDSVGAELSQEPATPLRAALFDRSAERAAEVRKAVEELTREVESKRW